MRRLLLFALLLMLLAACGGNATPATPAPAATATPPTPTHTSTATATPAPTFTPSPTPLPPGLRQIESQLETGWGIAQAEIQQSPASQSEVARLAAALGVSPEDLGQVYRVEANGTVFYASAETGKSYAIREVPSYFKYENGEEVIVDAHDEGLEVVRLVDDATEFSHWGNGKVVEVAYANGEHGWIYQGENGEWEKIYESGFDYEFLSRLAEHFEEVTGVDYHDWAEGKMGGNTFPAKLDIEQVHKRGKAQWVTGRYTGFHLGANWVHTEQGNFLVEVEAFPMYDRNVGRNETALVPVLVGVEQNGQWRDLIGIGLNLDGSLRNVWLAGNEGAIEPSKENLEKILMSDENLGKAESTTVIVYMDVDGVLKLDGHVIDDEEAAKYGWVMSLNQSQLQLIREHLPDWASWFGNLSVEDQIALMKAIRKRGMLGVAVFEDDPALEEMLQQYSIEEEPAGFWLWSLDVDDEIQPKLGQWIYP